MKKTIAIMILFGILLLPTVSSLSINSPTQTLDMYGGDTTTYNITFTGEETAVTGLTTTITPDPEGVSVFLSKYHFLLEDGESETIEVTVSLAPHIKPDTYKITVNTESYEVSEEVKEVIKRKTVYIETHPDDNSTDLLDIIENLTRQRNEYYDELKDLRDDLNKTENQTDTVIKTKVLEKTPIWAISTIIALTALLILLVIIVKKYRKGENKK